MLEPAGDDYNSNHPFVMTIDPASPAVSLLAESQPISPVEQQNRYGMRHVSIPDLEPGKFVTILVVRTPEALSEEQFFDILTYLNINYDVDAMQTAFAAAVPEFGERYRNDLHLSAHLRAEQRDFD